MLDSGGRVMIEYNRAESPSDFIMEAIDTNALGYKKWEPNFKLITHSPQPAERYSLFTDNERMNEEIDYQSLIKNAQESMNTQVHAKHRSEEAYSQENLSNWLKDYSNTPFLSCNQDEKQDSVAEILKSLNKNNGYLSPSVKNQEKPPEPERERDIFDDFVGVVNWFLGRR